MHSSFSPNDWKGSEYSMSKKSRITVNGHTYEGDSVKILNNKVYIDGEYVEDLPHTSKYTSSVTSTKSSSPLSLPLTIVTATSFLILSVLYIFSG